MTQVWIPDEVYRRVTAPFLKRAKGKYAKAMLRARMAPIGLSATCGGTCEGGWCKEVIISSGPDITVTACQCAYFV